jgi:hypothetical protein
LGLRQALGPFLFAADNRHLAFSHSVHTEPPSDRVERLRGLFPDRRPGAHGG